MKLLLTAIALISVKLSGQDSYARRVSEVTRTPGLIAFWNFVERTDGPTGKGNFVALTSVNSEKRYELIPKNISREFWKTGEEATLSDFPLLGRGPFGQSVRFQDPKTLDDLPVLMVPRKDLHDSPLDVKGPGKSVSMVIWLLHEKHDHAIAGIWQEGTDSPPKGTPAKVIVPGRRQFGMFAGLGANTGSASVHISENGLASFGDVYARHLAATPEKLTHLRPGATDAEMDASWSVIGFTYDNLAKSITAYLNGVATEFWVKNPAEQNFYKHAAKAWKQARLAKIPGLQPGEDPDFQRDQFYEPPESVPLEESIESEMNGVRIVLRTYAFTKVRVTLRKQPDGTYVEQSAELAAIRANPYYFGHDIFAPKSVEDGGPFTIGRVIHSNRHATLTAWFGGVAVYARALSPEDMRRLAAIGRPSAQPAMISFAEAIKSAGR